LIVGGDVIRTGRRDEKRSAERSALVAPSDASRHKPTGIDFFPGENVFLLFTGEMR
jgi:hypothetical protein